MRLRPKQRARSDQGRCGAENFGHHVHVDDISRIVDAGGISTQADVVVGGPPCQGFSTSNQRTRSVDNKKNWMFKAFIAFVKGTLLVVTFDEGNVHQQDNRIYCAFWGESILPGP